MGASVDTNPRIISAEADNKTVKLVWSHGETMECHSLWLRDQCGCHNCRHSQTHQRIASILDIPPDVTAERVTLSDDGIHITWCDGHTSSYRGRWLAGQTQRVYRVRQHRATLWHDEFKHNVPSTSYEQINNSAQCRLRLFKTLLDYGLVRVSDVPSSTETTESLARLIGYIRETPHGRVYDIKSHPETANIGYTSVALSPHTDAPYHYEAPGLVLFHFLEASTIGGESVLVDGFAVAQVLRHENPQAFELLTKHRWQYCIHEPNIDLRSEVAVITLSADGEYDRIVFNEYNASPRHLGITETEQTYQAWSQFAAIVNRPEMQVRLKVPPGEALLFDNRRILHARTAFDPTTGSRWLRSCYLDRDSFHNNVRVLARTLNDPLADAVFTTR